MNPTDSETGKTQRLLVIVFGVVVVLCGWGGVLYLLRR